MTKMCRRGVKQMQMATHGSMHDSRMHGIALPV